MKKGTIKAVSKIRDVDDGKQVGFMLVEEDGNWYNVDGTEDELKVLKNRILKKGNLVRFETSEVGKDGISNLTLLNKKSNKSNNSSKPDEDDFVKFPELLNKAHEEYGEKLNIETEIVLDAEGNPMIDFENKRAVARAEVTIKHEEGIQKFSGYGDATMKNTTERTKDSFIRMAETRAIVRALRFSTDDARTAQEEVGEGQK